MFRRKSKEPTLPPEWLIVGLGNPGPEYHRTRHNVGFDAIDLIAERAGQKLQTRKHQALYGVVTLRGQSVVLAKPMTYMNLSGQAVKALLREYSLSVENVLVITDDLDLSPGVVKMKPHGGAGGHNGHRSIIASLGTDRYPRIKVGIGKGEQGRDHVLSRFNPEERKDVDAILKRIADAVEILVTDGLDRALTALNTSNENG